MTKKDFWRNLPREKREEMAISLKTTHEGLRQIFMYGQKTGAKKARALAAYTGIGAHEFCPAAFSADDVLSLNIAND